MQYQQTQCIRYASFRPRRRELKHHHMIDVRREANIVEVTATRMIQGPLDVDEALVVTLIILRRDLE